MINLSKSIQLAMQKALKDFESKTLIPNDEIKRISKDVQSYIQSIE